MLSTLFLAFVALIAAVVLTLIARYLSRRTALRMGAGVVAWLLYVGALSYFGVVRNTAMRPPGVAFLFVPVAAFLVFLAVRAQSSSGTAIALAFPLPLLLATQSFRVVVELFLHQLWIAGLVPKMLTFEGANVDIYIGASAPFIAWLSTRGRSGQKIALVWNWLGLCALANVVIRAVLTAPGPLHLIHAEIPNQMIGRFPFTFLPGFLVPLAITLHILAIRAIGARRS